MRIYYLNQCREIQQELGISCAERGLLREGAVVREDEFGWVGDALC